MWGRGNTIKIYLKYFNKNSVLCFVSKNKRTKVFRLLPGVPRSKRIVRKVVVRDGHGVHRVAILFLCLLGSLLPLCAPEGRAIASFGR